MISSSLSIPVRTALPCKPSATVSPRQEASNLVPRNTFASLLQVGKAEQTSLPLLDAAACQDQPQKLKEGPSLPFFSASPAMLGGDGAVSVLQGSDSSNAIVHFTDFQTRMAKLAFPVGSHAQIGPETVESRLQDNEPVIAKPPLANEPADQHPDLTATLPAHVERLNSAPHARQLTIDFTPQLITHAEHVIPEPIGRIPTPTGVTESLNLAGMADGTTAAFGYSSDLTSSNFDLTEEGTLYTTPGAMTFERGTSRKRRDPADNIEATPSILSLKDVNEGHATSLVNSRPHINLAWQHSRASNSLQMLIMSVQHKASIFVTLPPAWEITGQQLRDFIAGRASSLGISLDRVAVSSLAPEAISESRSSKEYRS